MKERTWTLFPWENQLHNLIWGYLFEDLSCKHSEASSLYVEIIRRNLTCLFPYNSMRRLFREYHSELLS